jgi:hypothetical protein
VLSNFINYRFIAFGTGLFAKQLLNTSRGYQRGFEVASPYGDPNFGYIGKSPLASLSVQGTEWVDSHRSSTKITSGS